MHGQRRPQAEQRWRIASGGKRHRLGAWRRGVSAAERGADQTDLVAFVFALVVDMHGRRASDDVQRQHRQRKRRSRAAHARSRCAFGGLFRLSRHGGSVGIGGISRKSASEVYAIVDRVAWVPRAKGVRQFLPTALGTRAPRPYASETPALPPSRRLHRDLAPGHVCGRRESWARTARPNAWSEVRRRSGLIGRASARRETRNWSGGLSAGT